MKLGVNTVLFGGHDLRTAMEHIKWSGYDACEISAIKGMCEHLRLDDWRAQAAEIRGLVEEFDLPVTAMEVASLEADRLLPAFEAGAEIGIPVVNVGPGGQMDNGDDLKRSIDTLAEMAEKAEPFGVTLCVKAHVGAAIWNTATTLRAMAEISSPAFGIDMDPSHIHRAGENPAVELPNVIAAMKHIHIRDCLGEGPSPGEPMLQACGRGNIDLFGYFDAMVKANYDGPVCLEIIGPNQTMPQACAIAAESYGYMNAILKKLGAR